MIVDSRVPLLGCGIGVIMGKVRRDNGLLKKGVALLRHRYTDWSIITRLTYLSIFRLKGKSLKFAECHLLKSEIIILREIFDIKYKQ